MIEVTRTSADYPRWRQVVDVLNEERQALIEYQKKADIPHRVRIAITNEVSRLCNLAAWVEQENTRF